MTWARVKFLLHENLLGINRVSLNLATLYYETGSIRDCKTSSLRHLTWLNIPVVWASKKSLMWLNSLVALTGRIPLWAVYRGDLRYLHWDFLWLIDHFRLSLPFQSLCCCPLPLAINHSQLGKYKYILILKSIWEKAIRLINLLGLRGRVWMGHRNVFQSAFLIIYWL